MSFPFRDAISLPVHVMENLCPNIQQQILVLRLVMPNPVAWPFAKQQGFNVQSHDQ